MSINTALYALTAGQTLARFSTQRQQAAGVEAQGAYRAQVAETNAHLADQQAADAIARGKEAEQRQRTATRGLVGSQRAALAAQGIEVNSGSALDVQADAAGLGELDALTIRNNARREAYGYQVQALNARQQGQFATLAAGQEAKALRNASFSTLLTGAANTYGLYRQYHQSGGKKKSSASGAMVGSTYGLGRG